MTPLFDFSDVVLTLENDGAFYAACTTAMRRFGIRSTTTEYVITGWARKLLQAGAVVPSAKLLEYFAERYEAEIMARAEFKQYEAGAAKKFPAPKIPSELVFGSLPDEAKDALKAAHARGELIEVWNDAGVGWAACSNPLWAPGCCYRIAPLVLNAQATTLLIQANALKPGTVVFVTGRAIGSEEVRDPTVRESDLAAVLRQRAKPTPVSAPSVKPTRLHITPEGARTVHAAVQFPVHVEGPYPHAFLEGD